MTYTAIEIDGQKLCPVILSKNHEQCMRPIVKDQQVCKFHEIFLQRAEYRQKVYRERLQRQREEALEKSTQERERRDNLHNKLWHTAPNLVSLLDDESKHWWRLSETQTWEVLLAAIHRDRLLWVKATNLEEVKKLMPGGEEEDTGQDPIF